MREIKFRGKAKISAYELDRLQIEHKDGWVFGSLVTNAGRPFIVGDIVEQDTEYIAHEWWVEVYPETVGQFIGLTDLQGKEVFEGDVYERELHLVMYGSDLNELCIERHSVTWNGDCGGYYFGQDPVYAVLFQKHDHHTLCRVTKLPSRVGNIHDNPELLEVQP